MSSMNTEEKKDKDALRWEAVKTEHLVKDEWIDFRRVAYRLPDGIIREPYYNFSRRSYVVIVATDKEGQYICVCQYRYGINEVTTEFVAGGIECEGKAEYLTAGEDPGKAEDTLAAAKRELQEETGYVSDEWEHLFTVPSNAMISDNYAYIYRARNCRKESSQEPDDGEFLTVETHSETELEDLIDCGRFQQAVHVMAYLLAKRREA